MSALLIGIIPSLSFILLIFVELPKKYRNKVMKVPSFISSSIVSVTIAWFVKGVTGGLAGMIAELILYPTFAFYKYFNRRPKNGSKSKFHRCINCYRSIERFIGSSKNN